MKQDIMTTKKPFRFYKFSKPKTSTTNTTPVAKTTIPKPKTPQVKAKNKKVEFY
jgi:hypothetical protein